MKIIEWNCQGALRKKHKRILSEKPDILVVSECEAEAKLKFGDLTPKPNDFFWYGDSPNKGIGVFSYSDYKFELLPCFNPRFRYIIPLKVTSKESSFLLFAIWAMGNQENPNSRYIGQVWQAINFYEELFSVPCILTGDFNSNKIWDEKARVGTHSDMITFLGRYKIYSLYHLQEQIEQGEEPHPTFHLHRNLKKPYHIDYFFASESIIQKGFKLLLGKAENWMDISDHIPLTLEYDAKPRLSQQQDSLSDILNDKLDKLSKDTQKRFRDIIENLKVSARQVDRLEEVTENLSERKKLLEKYEVLCEIDWLLKKF